ncbi:MAG: hypothetical protein ACLS3Y_05990 [Collinsella sp.]
MSLRVCRVDDARNQALGLINIKQSAAGQAIGLEAVENARDTRAIDADGAELIGVRETSCGSPCSAISP